LAVAILLTTAFAGSALADQPVNPNGHTLTLLSVTYLNPYTTNAVTLYNYRLTWNGQAPGLSHVDLNICSTLRSSVNSLYTTPGYVFGDGSAPNQCSLPGFPPGDTTNVIVKWQSSVLTLVGDHYDFTLAISGTYGTGTTNWVAFAGSQCQPPTGSTIEGPSCDTTVGCPGFPWCPPVCIAPKLSVKPVDQTVCPNDTPAAFTATTTGTVTSIQWLFNGNPIEGANSLSYTPTLGAGTYTINVSATCGSDSASATLTIRKATTLADLTPQTVCDTATAVSFTADGDGESVTYAWSVTGPNSYSASGTGASYTTASGLAAGSYSVSVTATGTCGPVTKSTTLTVNKTTTSGEIQGDKTFCDTAEKTFSVTADGAGLSYAWTLDDAPVGGNSSSVTVGPLSAGSHTLAVTVSGTCGSVTKSANLTVNLSTSSGEIQGDKTFCDTATSTLSVSAQGTNLSYAWTLDDVSTGGNTSSITVGPLSAGSHSVSVTITGTCGTVTKTASLTVNKTTTSGEIQGDTTFCDTAQKTFSVTADGSGLSYVWKLDGNTTGGNSSSVTVGPLSAGSHTLTVTVSGACGTVTKSASLTVNRSTSSNGIQGKVSLCGFHFPATYSVSANGTNLHYQWNLDSTDVGTDSNQYTIGTLALGSHTLSVTITGTCGVVTKTVAITVADCPPTCTLTQGAWGSFGGAGNFAAIYSAVGGGLTVGSGANTFSISNSTYDVNCTIQRLPAGGSPAALPAGANGFTANSNCLTSTSRNLYKGKTIIGTTDGMLTGTTSKDKFNNVLLGQTLTLSLNVASDGGATGNLATTALCKYMKVDTVAGGSPRTLDSVGGIPQKVWDDLGSTPTVQGLLNLANSYLGGSVSTASYSEVNQAVTAINQLFDACPTQRYVVSCLPSAPIQLASGVTQLASGVTPIGLCSTTAAIGNDGSIVDVTIPGSILKVMSELGLKTELRGFVELRQMVRDGYDNLSFEELNIAIYGLNEAVAQQRTIVSCSDR
jgi:hypothetical protein